MKVNILKTDKPNVCFVGDIHGEFKSIRGLVKKTEFTDTTFVFAGDCGFGFESEAYYVNNFNMLSKVMKQYNDDCVFIRGNHDDPSYYSDGKIRRKHFTTVPDYTVLKTPNHNILCVGGAVSVDRKYRLNSMNVAVIEYARYHNCTVDEAAEKARKCYWKDELPIFDEEALDDLDKSGINIDVVCTHTGPSFVKPLDRGDIQTWLAMDKELGNDLTYERDVMTRIFNRLKKDGHPLEKWFYGHFHMHNSEYIDGVHFVCLDRWRNGTFDIFDLR